MAGVGFELSSLYNRGSDLPDRFGGQRQGGIATLANASVVFAFTGEEGAAHGYGDTRAHYSARSHAVRDYILGACPRSCEGCLYEAPFLRADASPFFEVPLGVKNLDTGTEATTLGQLCAKTIFPEVAFTIQFGR